MTFDLRGLDRGVTCHNQLLRDKSEMFVKTFCYILKSVSVQQFISDWMIVNVFKKLTIRQLIVICRHQNACMVIMFTKQNTAIDSVKLYSNIELM